ncbi:MAG: NADH-quinone oxidoreductase subunit N [Calditrichaeota bacterium]|nr:MAG: NADH-quinone oxidoreductase subunit N [Calditrichota bacterium]
MKELVLSSENLLAVSPAIVLTLTGFLVVILRLVNVRISRAVLLFITVAGMAVAALFSLRLWGDGIVGFGGMVSSDPFALTFNFIFLLGAVLSVLLSSNDYEESYLLYAEYFAIVLFATVGMVLMAASTNLVVLFLGLETLSISLYVLAGIKRNEERSLEAAFKYFLLGAFASAFLLYGIAFIYGSTGTLDLRNVATFVTHSSVAEAPLLMLGALLVIVGLGFKIAMFPFHMWAPDVYQGAPTPITAFMSTGSKAAGFAAMLRVLFSATDGTAADWTAVFWVLAVLTMTVGNISALLQKNVKRMLAYSSIAHAGYILVGLVAWNSMGAASMVFYLLAYTFMNVGAFGVISYLAGKESEFQELDDLRGLAFQRPTAAIVMAIFMFSLAGLPPTAGFVGKFYIFSAAVKAGHVPLVIIGVVNSMISAYYYLGLVVTMFMRQPARDWGPQKRLPSVALSLAVAVVGTFALGLFPSALMDQIQAFISSMI